MLLLGDGRLPSGGHAHSGGVEAAITDGRIVDITTLEAFVIGRLSTTGLTEASLAAATVHALTGTTTADHTRDVLAVLDLEAEARIIAPALRMASRRLGRQLARVAGRCWPHPVLASLADAAPDGAHQPVALGACGFAAGVGVQAVADLAVHHAVSTPAQAAVRLLGLDPYAVAALTADMASLATGVAAAAVAAATGPFAELPAPNGPILDIAATEHAGRDARMFAT
ncbi:MAG: urease accessory protein UreF [Acidobacteria bacterium]|nr:urease accessory protein UreF [Acidobacteriota bacterium]